MRFFLPSLSLGSLFVAGLGAQISVTGPDFTYSQSFSANLPVASGTPAWVDDSYFPGWYIVAETSGTPATIRVNSTATSGSFMHYRPSAGSSDGSLGGRPNDASGAMIYGLRLVNNSGETLTGFSLAYTGRQITVADTDGNENNQIVASYQLGATAPTGGTWPIISGLTFSSIFDDAIVDSVGGSASNLNGNDPANFIVLDAVNVTGINWAPGQELWIRFRDANSAGVDHGLTIDDVNFTVIPEPGALAALFGLATLGFVVLRRPRRG